MEKYEPEEESEDGEAEESEEEEEIKPTTKRLVGVRKPVFDGTFSNLDEEVIETPKVVKSRARCVMVEEELDGPKQRKVKLNTGIQKKESDIPSSFKKGKWNPNVEIPKQFEQLESGSVTPNFECGVMNCNRELIRAAYTGNKVLLEKVIHSDRKISNLMDKWGVDESSKSAFEYLIEREDKQLMSIFLDALNNSNKLKFTERDTVDIEKQDTGYNSKYAYGVALRRVEMSRGGRQGLNALTQEDNEQGLDLDSMNICQILIRCSKLSVDMLKLIILKLKSVDELEQELISKADAFFINGNILVGIYLLELAKKNDGFGLNEYYLPAIKSDNVKDVEKIKKVSVTKKSMEMSSIAPIHLASLNPCTDILKKLVEICPEVSHPDLNLRKPIHFAATCQSTGPLKFLLDSMAEAAALDNKKMTPLMYAASTGRLDNMKLLHKANDIVLMNKSRKGLAAIHYAALGGHKDAIKFLLEQGVDVNTLAANRVTCLQIASRQGDYELVQFLVENGASVLLKDKFKRSPLIMSCLNGHLKIAAFLLKHGSAFDDADSSGNTPLHYACSYGYPEIISILLKAGADPNKLNDWNLSPSTLTILKSYPSCLKTMLEYSETDTSCVDQNGRTLLCNAVSKVSHRDIELVEYLLKVKKADPNVPDTINQMTGFDYLFANGFNSILKKGIKKGMSESEVDQVKDDALKLYKKYIKLFIDAGVNVNHQDITGYTALHHALSVGNMEGVRILLDNPKVNAGIIPKDGRNALYLLANSIDKPHIFEVFEKIFRLMGKEGKYHINTYTDDGMTLVQYMFLKAVEMIPGYKDKCFKELQEQSIRSKNNHSGKIIKEISKGNKTMKKYPGLKGGARTFTKMTARKFYPMKKRPFKRRSFKAAKKSRPFKKTISSSKQLRTFEKYMNYEVESDQDVDEEDEEADEEEEEEIQQESSESDEESVENSEKEDDNSEDSDERGDNSDEEDREIIKQTSKGISILSGEEIKELEKESQNMYLDKVGEVIEILKFLIKNGADLNMRVKNEKKIPTSEKEKKLYENEVNFDFAKYFEHYIKRIHDTIESKQSRKIRMISRNVGNILLHTAAFCTDISIYKFLIETAKIKINVQNIFDETEVLRFVRQSEPTDQSCEVLEYLLKAGLNPNLADYSGTTPLMLSIKESKMRFVQILVDHKASVNHKSQNGETALMFAVKNRNMSLVEILLRAGANPNFQDAKNRTALHYAINSSGKGSDSSNSIEKILLEAGSNVNTVDIRGRTPLHYAFIKIRNPFSSATIDPIQTVSTLVSRKGVNVNVRDNWGNTPLNYAAQRGSVISTVQLLKYGADINNKNNSGNNSLAISLLNKHQNLSIILIQNNIDLKSSIHVISYAGLRKKITEAKQRLRKELQRMNQMRYNSMSDDEDDEGEFNKQDTQSLDIKLDLDDKPLPHKSLFSYAVKNDWEGVSYLLLEYGYPLQSAISDSLTVNKLNYAYGLLSSIPTKEISKYLDSLYMVFKYADRFTEDTYMKLIMIFDQCKVDFNKLGSQGLNALHYACQSKSERVVKYLLEQKHMDMNMSDKNSMTPLGYLLKYNLKRFEKFIPIISKASTIDMNKRFLSEEDGVSHTCLTYIMSKNLNLKMVSGLIEMGCDVNGADSRGRTPIIHLIRHNRLTDIKIMVTKYSVDVDCVDKEGKNIIHHIVKTGDFVSFENTKMMEYLGKKNIVNKKDSSGRSPMWYAKQQGSGRMKEALLKLGAKDDSMDEEVKRVSSKAVYSKTKSSNFQSHHDLDFYSDFEKFDNECKRKSESKKKTYVEKVPVDESASGNLEVVYEEENPFDVYMVKVEIKRGRYSGNTFYRMQLLQEKIRKVYILFTKWGMVGTNGQFQHTPFGKIEDAKKEFCSIFKSKSGNDWSDRHNFEKKPKKYKLVKLNPQTKYEDYVRMFDMNDKNLKQSKLDGNVYSMMKSLCNTKIMKNALASVNYDTHSRPLTALPRNSIIEARNILANIGKLLEQFEAKSKKNEDVEELMKIAEEITGLSNMFYEIIPSTQSRGWRVSKSTAPQPISNNYQLQNCMNMVNDLEYYEAVLKMIGAATYNMNKMNPIDYCFYCLNTNIDVMDKQSSEFAVLNSYITNSMKEEIKNSKFQVHNIYSIDRQQERDRVSKWDKYDNRMLLWHGTKAQNIVGILQCGFLISPSFSTYSGSMFGSGVYFSDSYQKSFNYSFQNSFSDYEHNEIDDSKLKRYVFLCEVILGTSKKLYESVKENSIPNIKQQSVMGVGREGPDPEHQAWMPSGTLIPLGKITQTPKPKGIQYMRLQNNEYVVYDVSQIVIRYMIESTIDNQ